MKEKLLEYFNKIVEKVKSYIPKSKAQDSMKIVIAYGLLIFVIALAFMASWIYSGIKTGNFDIDIMLRFFSAATAPGPVAAVTFISVFLVDKNGDGRPDAAEDRAEEKTFRLR